MMLLVGLISLSHLFVEYTSFFVQIVITSLQQLRALHDRLTKKHSAAGS